MHFVEFVYMKPTANEGYLPSSLSWSVLTDEELHELCDYIIKQYQLEEVGDGMWGSTNSAPLSTMCALRWKIADNKPLSQIVQELPSFQVTLQ